MNPMLQAVEFIQVVVIAFSKNIYPRGPHLIEKGTQRLASLVLGGGWTSGKSDMASRSLKYVVNRRMCLRLQWNHGKKVNITWNMDDSGIFWQALPDNGFGQRGETVPWGERGITIAFFVSAAYCNMEVWKSNKSDLVVNYFSQGKAWMDISQSYFILYTKFSIVNENSYIW